MNKLVFLFLIICCIGCGDTVRSNFKHPKIERVFFNTHEGSYSVMYIDEESKKLLHAWYPRSTSVYMDVSENEPIWGEGIQIEFPNGYIERESCQLHIHSAKEIGGGNYKSGKHTYGNAEVVE